MVETHSATTRDAAGFIRAICLNPADDLPRLVYADWLDERAGDRECQFCKDATFDTGDHGGPLLNPKIVTHLRKKCSCGGTGRVSDGRRERAEFIRVQVELATGWPILSQVNSESVIASPRFFTLRRRERELFTFSNIQRWFREPGPVFDRHTVDPAEFNQLKETCRATGISAALVRRGFVSAVSAPLSVLFGGPCGRCRGGIDNDVAASYSFGCRYCSGTGTTPGIAAELFRAQPVEQVTLTDREPHHPGESGWGWMSDAVINHLAFPEAAVLPAALCNCLTGYELAYAYFGFMYDTRAAALDALRFAAVALGRKLAEIDAAIETAILGPNHD